MSIELKVKGLSLAAEARIIRALELRMKKRFQRTTFKRERQPEELQLEYKQAFDQKLSSLHNHRVVNVRRASRSTHLARAYLKAMPYFRVEETCYDLPDFTEVAKLVRQYGGEGHDNVTWHTIRDWARVYAGHLKDGKGKWYAAKDQ